MATSLHFNRRLKKKGGPFLSQFYCDAALWKTYTSQSLQSVHFTTFFTPLSGNFVGRAMRRSLEALINRELRFILGDYSFPTKQSSH